MTDYDINLDNTSVQYAMKRNEDFSRNERGGKITANDILSGNENDLLNGVLTSMITIFCNMSGYVIIVPVSPSNPFTYSGKSHTYVNFCTDDPLRTLTEVPQSLYSESNTVLLADLTGGKNYLDVIDRSILVVGSSDEMEELNWIEWSISCNVMNIGNLLLRSEGGNVNSAVSATNIALNKVLMEAWSAGKVDDVLKSRNNNIISTSVVGSERYIFTKAVDGVIDNNDAADDTDVNTKNIPLNTDNGDSNEKDNDDRPPFKAIQAIGIGLFVSVIVGVTILTRIAGRKRLRDEVNYEANLRMTNMLEGLPYIITGARLESDLSIDADEADNERSYGSENESLANYSRCLV